MYFSLCSKELGGTELSSFIIIIIVVVVVVVWWRWLWCNL